MAALTASQCVWQWSDGLADRAALFALRNVTAADTADLSAYFSVLKRAVILGTTVSGAAAASVNGTTATLPNGLTNDAGYLLVWGCSA